MRPTPAAAPPTPSAPPQAPHVADRLRLYRLLAGFPMLASFRAKLFAVILLGILIPAFLLVLGLVLGAGRASVLTIMGLVVVLAIASAGFVLWGVDRLLAPLNLATRAIDDIALGGPVSRTDLPGNDAAAQVLRGVTALAGRVQTQAGELRALAERDELTGLLNRRAGRSRGQAMLDEATRRGMSVRLLLADIRGFSHFNATHGSGHADALLKAMATRFARLVGDDGVAARWEGDCFLLMLCGTPETFPDTGELLGRPVVVKGAAEPLQITFGVAEVDRKTAVDALIAMAEADLATRRAASRPAQAKP